MPESKTVSIEVNGLLTEDPTPEPDFVYDAVLHGQRVKVRRFPPGPRPKSYDALPRGKGPRQADSQWDAVVQREVERSGQPVVKVRPTRMALKGEKVLPVATDEEAFEGSPEGAAS